MTHTLRSLLEKLGCLTYFKNYNILEIVEAILVRMDFVGYKSDIVSSSGKIG